MIRHGEAIRSNGSRERILKVWIDHAEQNHPLVHHDHEAFSKGLEQLELSLRQGD